MVDISIDGDRVVFSVEGLDKLIDDTEASDWASIGSPVTGKSVTVDLAGTHPQLVSRVQVSALLRPLASRMRMVVSTEL